MSDFDYISDEQLGCFIEDNLSEAESDYILDAVSSDSDMDILSIAYHASQLTEEVDSPEIIVDISTSSLWELSNVAMCAMMPSMPSFCCNSMPDGNMEIAACCESSEESSEEEEEDIITL